ncbi:MAG: hypothetical protein WBW71_16565 [Bacteroidota bacterium]
MPPGIELFGKLEPLNPKYKRVGSTKKQLTHNLPIYSSNYQKIPISFKLSRKMGWLLQVTLKQSIPTWLEQNIK